MPSDDPRLCALASTRLRALREPTRWHQRDLVLFVAALVVVACVWAFFAVAEAIHAGRTQMLDQQVVWLLREPGQPSQPVGPAWPEGAVRFLTVLGSSTLLVLFSIAAVLALLARRQFHALALMVFATIGGQLMNEFLKGSFERPRPNPVFHLTEVESPGFPSGHAMDSAVTYLTLAAVLSRLVQPRVVKVLFAGVAMLLTFLAGASRVYLGVHYPSDVVAGWIAGLGWALLCWTVAGYLQGRGKVEAAK